MVEEDVAKRPEFGEWTICHSQKWFKSIGFVPVAVDERVALLLSQEVEYLDGVLCRSADDQLAEEFVRV